MSEPTLKQWKLRALVAEEELATIRKMRAFDKNQEMKSALENAAMRVALREIQETSNWAYGMVAEKLS
jgi:lipopolysaccharide biosynthesis protein